VSLESNEVPFVVIEDTTEPPSWGLEVEIYQHDAPQTLISVVPLRWSPSFLDELHGPGGGSFTISMNDSRLEEYPDLLDYRNVVKVKVNGEYVGAFLIQKKAADFVGEGEYSEAVWKVSGESLRTWLHDATVLPYAGLKSKSADSRNFNFAAERGDWFKASEWKSDVRVQQHNLDPNSGPFKTAPANWPDAQWLVTTTWSPMSMARRCCGPRSPIAGPRHGVPTSS
jgi:hypothetical protein